MSDRVERNWKMANAASPNVSLPPSKAYRDNYVLIFKPRKPKTQTTKTCKPQTRTKPDRKK